MKRILIGILFLWIHSTVFAEIPATPPPPGPERPLNLPKITERTLPNGLVVVVAPLPGIPKINTILSFHAGRATWRQQHPGAPALAAEVLRQGTTNRSALQIQQELRSLGASLNVSAQEDSTDLTGAALSEFSEGYFELLNDIVRNANFPDPEVELAKQNLIQSIQGQRADPNFLASEQLRKAIFGDHPYSFLVPDEQSIGKITSNHLKEFAKTFYLPNNAHLIIAGDIDASRAFALAEKVFGSWKKETIPEETYPRAIRRDKRQIIFVQRPGSVQSTMTLGIATFPRNDPDYFSTRTADTIFGGSFNSRLTQNIREKRGYTYSPSSSNFTMARSGMFTVNAAVRNEVTGPTLLEMFYELDRMRVLPVTKEELDSAKIYQNGTFSIELASQSGLAARIQTIYAYGLPRDFIETFRQKINALTEPDIQKASARYFDTYRCAIVVVGDYDKVKDQLEPFGEILLLDDKGNRIDQS